MKAIVGIIIVFVCVFGSYAIMGGHLGVLWEPFEFVIILGSAVGAYIIGNPPVILKRTKKSFGAIFKGCKYKKADFVELISMQYQVYKLIKSKGVLAIESHIENPHESSLFQAYPGFHHDHHATEFFCDYLRMISLGSDDPMLIEDLMNKELEVHHEEDHALGSAMQGMADGLPALGIVAAVLGIIKTMGSITEPPAVLGHMIGGALVGTFFGVFVAYGFFAPFSSAINATFAARSKYMECLKSGLLAHLQGCAPAISVEFARKSLTSDVRPTFYEVEAALQNIQPIK